MMASTAGMLSMGVYLAWTLATYLLEGRVQLLLHPDPLGRALCAVVANILIGTILSSCILGSSIQVGIVTPDQVGLRGAGRTLIAVAVASVLGFGVFLLQNPRTLEPIVLLNAFSQVLPTSIAEIVVCWALVGATVESLARARGQAVAMTAGVAVAAALFGPYHFAHSPPFNHQDVRGRLGAEVVDRASVGRLSLGLQVQRATAYSSTNGPRTIWVCCCC